MSEHSLKSNFTFNGLNSFFERYQTQPNSMLARIYLAFLTTAGIFYINIMPAVINGLKEGLDFSNQQAGFVSSANLYGAALGALSAVFLIKHINWRLWAYTLLVILIAIDLSCIFIQQPISMIAIRAFHGLAGGLLVGIGFAIISRTTEADKTFGYLLLIQWSLGGLGIMYLPGLVPSYGTGALFVSLITFTSVTLLMLPFLPTYEIEQHAKTVKQQSTIEAKPMLMNLLGIFLFQAANMGLFAYMISLGKADGLTVEYMSNSLGIASWIALFGALLVIIIGTKYGRTLPLIIAILITALCSWLLHFSAIAEVYLITNILIGITWAFVLPYLFGICAELDKAGQMAAMGGFASKMGLASGPMVAALLFGSEVVNSEVSYSLIINIASFSLVICALVIILPARLLDKSASTN